MLQQLIIRNYAIIDDLQLSPDAHLNTITGETGAGKSIILGALSLILGERADTSVLINKNEKCVVESHFNVRGNEALKHAMQEEDVDYEEDCVIRREISSSGKSRAFINDTPVTLPVLNRLTSLLVDLQQQFGHLALEDDDFQVDVLDAIAQNTGLIKKYRQLYAAYKTAERQLQTYITQQSNARKEADYKQFLYEELEQAALKEEELELAAQQLKQMSGAERIIGVLQAVQYILEEGESPVNNELKRAAQQLQSIMDIVPDATALQTRLLSALAEIKDVSAELEQMQGKVLLDEELMVQLQERIDTGYRLLKKHGVATTSELLAIQHELAKELKVTADMDSIIEKLSAEKEVFFKQLIEAATTLSTRRNQVVPEITAKINDLLALVGMPNARFQISFKKCDPTYSGIDEVQFMLDANKSGRFLPIVRSASGGELSRIMLCIKSLTADALQLPTLIFDEVDTGISGEAAKQVAILLRDLAEYHQVICITHQPQVAAKGTRHFFVYKEQGANERITTNIRILQPEERVLAVAQMIGGDRPSDAALQNARELVTV